MLFLYGGGGGGGVLGDGGCRCPIHVVCQWCIAIKVQGDDGKELNSSARLMSYCSLSSLHMEGREPCCGNAATVLHKR